MRFALPSVLAFAFAWASAERASAQAPGAPPPIVISLDGTELFRDELARHGLSPIDERNWEKVPSKRVLILIGDLSWAGRQLPKIRDFVGGGGVLLIATDVPMPFNQIIYRELGLELSAEVVVSTKETSWRKNPQLPWMVPRRGFFGKRPAKAIFPPVLTDSSVATNRPRALSEDVRAGRWPGLVWTPLAGFPKGSTFEPDLTVKRIGPAKPEPIRGDLDLLAWSGTLGAGRVVVFGNVGPFINTVVQHSKTENLNFEFLGHLADWLARGDGGDRSETLFVENGIVQTRFALPRSDRPEVPFDVMANIVLNGVNRILAEPGRAEQMNEAIGPNAGNNTKRVFLIWVGLFLTGLGLWRVMSTRAGADPAKLFLAGLPRVQMWGRTGRSRVTSMIEEGQLYEAARFRVRSRMETVFAASILEARPQIVIDDRVRNPRVLETRIQNIWNIGYGKTPLVVNPDGWKIFNEDLIDTIDAFHDRDWTFEPRRTA